MCGPCLDPELYKLSVKDIFETIVDIKYELHFLDDIKNY